MRILLAPLVAAFCAWLASSASAQPAGSPAADHNEVGHLQTRVQKYDQALGVISQLSRSQSASVECNGVCYFPNSSRPLAWKCDPGKRCDLHCTVSPPVGGCN